MPMNLFIDANIFLSFYHMTSEDLDQLNQLPTLLKDDPLRLYLTDQVKHEVERNREKQIADAMTTLRHHKYKFTFPHMCKGYEEYEQIHDRLLRDCTEAHNTLIERLEEDIREEQLDADKSIRAVFEAALAVPTTVESLDRARTRKELGNPPGKRNSLGDPLNWELLLDALPQMQDLYLISRDGDFKSSLNDDRLHSFLDNEWTERKESKLHFYGTLTGFFKHKFPNIKLLADFKKDLLISNLAKSGSFASTHNCVAQLQEYGNDFSTKQLKAIVAAAVSNSQIYLIRNDSDVRDFVLQLINGREEEIDDIPLKTIQVFFGHSENIGGTTKVENGEDGVPF